MRAVLTSIALLILTAFVVVAVVIGLGICSFAAEAPHTALVTKLIGLARERSIEVRAASVKVPLLNDQKMIREGAEHYAEMCVTCHLALGLPENEMRPGLNSETARACCYPAWESSGTVLDYQTRA